MIEVHEIKKKKFELLKRFRKLARAFDWSEKQKGKQLMIVIVENHKKYKEIFYQPILIDTTNAK